jgi:predicted NodU family carbamoyl transferase
MVILGINAYHADSSAAIFVDGKLIAATEEERFRRQDFLLKPLNSVYKKLIFS